MKNKIMLITYPDSMGGDLKGHEEEQAEVHPQGGDPVGDDLRVVVEDADEQFGEEHGHRPEQGGIGQGHAKGELDGLPYPVGLFGPVV